MAIQLSSLMKQVAETEIVYFEEKGIAKFRPGAISDNMFETVQAAADEDDENMLNRLLTEVMVEWDVVGEKGEMVPFTDAALKTLPIPFKAAVLEQVIEAARGNSKTSSVSSRAGSRRRGR